MTEELSLLHIIVLSLKNMFKEALIPCELYDEQLNQHKVTGKKCILMTSVTGQK